VGGRRSEVGGWRSEVGYDWPMRLPALRPLVSILLAAAFVAIAATPARADLTGFIGSNTTPAARAARGFALGWGLLIVGAEFEYSNTSEDLTAAEAAPALKTYMFNGILQTPVPIARTQFYGTVGGGIYHETLSIDAVHDQTSFGTNIGGGAKITLLGPLRLRLDYRVFNLRGGSARHTPVQRIYAGVNLKF
jgi:opacity protein-like surface antigen